MGAAVPTAAPMLKLRCRISRGIRSVPTTLIGTVRIWRDPESLNEAWRNWVGGRPPGSVAALSPHHQTRRFSLDGLLAKRVGGLPRANRRDNPAQSPFDAFPPIAVSHVWHRQPDLWRTETTADEGSKTGVLVLRGARSGFAVASREKDGTYRLETAKTSPLTMHGIIPDMVQGNRVMTLLATQPVGVAVQAGRECDRLVGSLVDPDEFPVWPADSYDVLFHRLSGVILRIEAKSKGGPIAGAAFTEVVFDGPIEEGAFDLSAPKHVELAGRS